MRGRVARRAALLAVACLVLGLALGACGGGGGDQSGESTIVTEKEHDVEVLNQILARQRAVVGAFDAVLPGLQGRALTLATQFRAQEQEHSVALLQALRDLGGIEEVEDEVIDPGDPRGEAGRLRFLYEVESESIEDGIGAIGRLDFGAPRALMAMIAANQAQHLVLLRRELGVKAVELVPSAFEDGATPGP